MDFLDPKKQRRHHIQLIIGYVLVAIAITMGTIVLLYSAYGFGLGKNGKVIQKGLVFVSTHPGGAQIYLNNTLNSSQTNARLSLLNGTYSMKLTRTGYRDWQRTIDVEGGAVAHYDYPFLIPTKLTSTPVKTYDAGTPGFATQSADKRWLIVEQPTSATNFDEYDLKNPKTAPVELTIPTTIATAGTTQSWQLVEWASDNQHALLKHTYDDKTEFIVFDRSDPTQSVNLNTTLNTTPTRVNLLNKKYNQYYVYDATTQDLQTVDLNNPTTFTPFLQHVIDYQPYGSNVMLYASSSASSANKVAIDLLQDGKTYSLREVSANTTYLLNLTQYNGSWFVALGASSEDKVFIYKNPVSQLSSSLGELVPIYILRNNNPTYLSFSNNAQFIMDENGSQFSVYDAMNDIGYNYNTKAPVDTPQPHATWMDGDRIMYVSGGKLVVFDYDDANQQTLMPASASYVPFFSPSYSFVDTLSAPTVANQTPLMTTPLLTPADQ